MENQLSEILDNILGLLLLEGSYEVEETEEGFSVSIETKDAGRLIGARGESLDALQQLINQIMSQRSKGTLPSKEGKDQFKRVVLDVASWRKQKEEELIKNAQDFGKQVLESGQSMELAPSPAWQRRIIHMTVSQMPGLSSESAGEGRDRHIVIKVKSENEKVKSEEN
mgnify:CR=1 FL=1